MKHVRVWDETRQSAVCDDCEVADNLFTRVRGLLGREALPDGHGLLIVPCPSIHMFGMKFSLDVLFLTRDNVVTDFVEDIAPGKAYVAKGAHGKAHAALELPSGTVVRLGLERGDKLTLEEK